MQNCEQCGGKRWVAKLNRKTGLQERHHIKGDGFEYFLRVWKCWRCDHVQCEVRPFVPLPQRARANILYLDIEVSKSLVYNFGLKVPSKYIDPSNLVMEWHIICWAASYVGMDKVWSGCISPKAARLGDDSAILQPIHDLMDSADIIAGHNLDRFDLKRLNTRFLLNGLDPIIHKKTLDTLKIARSKFQFESNKLDYISQRLGFRPKDDMSNADWLAIAKTGDEKTLRKMMKYNIGDVKNGKGVLERLMKHSGKKEWYGSTTEVGA